MEVKINGKNYAITIPKTPYNYFTIKHLLTTGVYAIKDMTMWTHIPVENFRDFYFRVKPINKGTAIEIEDASDADVVEAVRCKDCKWYGRSDKRRFYRGTKGWG